MKGTVFSVLCALGAVAAAGTGERQFGLHFDFHAKPEADGSSALIGGTLKESDIAEICDLYRPDFIQVDSKGHPGWTSYPSKLGNAMPRMAGDPLATWRKVTAAKGVGLYVHHSGVYERKYVLAHPDERVRYPDGRLSDSVAVDGPYADRLLIPQLKEIAGYGVDGVWMDGECWAAQADYSDRVVAAFERETGVRLGGKVPKFRGMPYYDDYRDYCRELYRRYLRHYIDAVHADYPKFRICSNWAFTYQMPEPVCADVSFLSGDLDPVDSVWSARLASRSVALQGKPWDMMSWSFRGVPDVIDTGKTRNVDKALAQLKQEASAVIASGGGFQLYVMQGKDGSPKMETVRRYAPLAEFVRSHQRFAFGGTARRQVAVLLSTHDRYREAKCLFNRNGAGKISGLINLFCEAGHSTSVVSEHHLDAKTIGAWPVIAVPQLFEGLAPETVKLLRDYAANGGKLVVTGDKARTLLAPECGARGDVRRPFGKGVILALDGDAGTDYAKNRTPEFRCRLNGLVKGLYDPEVKVLASDGVLEIVDLERDGRRLVQLVNGNGRHHDKSVATEEAIEPVRGIRLAIRFPEKPSALRLQPEGRDLAFDWTDGAAVVEIPEVASHSTVEEGPVLRGTGGWCVPGGSTVPRASTR